jgi:hypothetical protein
MPSSGKLVPYPFYPLGGGSISFPGRAPSPEFPTLMRRDTLSSIRSTFTRLSRRRHGIIFRRIRSCYAPTTTNGTSEVIGILETIKRWDTAMHRHHIHSITESIMIRTVSMASLMHLRGGPRLGPYRGFLNSFTFVGFISQCLPGEGMTHAWLPLTNTQPFSKPLVRSCPTSSTSTT